MSSSKKEIIAELEQIRDLYFNDTKNAGFFCRMLQYVFSFCFHSYSSSIDARLELLLQKIEDYGKSDARADGIAKARDARTDKTKEKIQNAINLLRIEAKEITAYQVAKVAGISYNTAKKYLNELQIS